MTKITSSTRSESLLDIDKFPTQDFKNRKYVFPNNELVAFFSLSVMYRCLSYKANACFFKLLNESTSLKPDCIWKAPKSKVSFSSIAKKQRLFVCAFIVMTPCGPGVAFPL